MLEREYSFVFELPHCTLRPPRGADATAIARLADNPRIWRNLRDRFPSPYQLLDAETFIASRTDWPPRTFLIEVDGEAAGVVGFDGREDVERATMEIGYWLGEPFWGRGIATEAVRAATEYAFATFPIRRVEGVVFGWNPASARVLEKAGFSLEGRLRAAVTKDDSVTDLLVFGLVR
jgi:ribosomal-protein-alanine N-acetyltransferase